LEINLLALNVGNSRLAIGAFVAGELKYVNRIPHTSRADWSGAIAEAWKLLKGRENPAVAGASVNPPIVETLEHVVHQVTGAGTEWIGREIELPIKILTEQPDQTGVDRILNIAAAYEQMGKACVVVDAGSAITVDCCNDQGDFLGGAIAPGFSMQLAVMHDKTARLPAVDISIPTGPFGKTTQQAMLQGVYQGIRGMLKELVENYATELGFWPDIIATGGDAARLFEGWELIHAISPDLTLYGIAVAYTNHHLKHDT
jgi:type III pantothenate kinase